jgi:O-methyltransferase
MNLFLKNFRKVNFDSFVENQRLNLLFEVEQPFNDLYLKGMAISKTPDSGNKRRARFYNLVSFLQSVNHIDAAVIECGCWKGLSSYLMGHYLKINNENFVGKDFYVLDSFEGLSDPSKEDVINDSLVDTQGERKGAAFKTKGAYSASLEIVKNVLHEFPSISFHKGWIPNSLKQLPSLSYKFVHIDLDLYEPIKGSLEYFYPKLVRGGIIICDDYGSLYWPGAKQAIEEFAVDKGIRFISLSSGQAVFIKN